ncbi:MAG: apoptotic protease-activating factor, partial [Cyanobacteria bacterium P01_A01_bin.137]
LSGLAEHLPESLLPEALEVTRQIQAESYRSSALSGLAEHLPESLLPEALEVTRQIQDESYRSSALSGLAEHLPELWPETLKVTRQIQNEYSRSGALRGLAEHLPELLPEALEVTRQIQAESYRSSALRGLAEHLPEPLWSEVLDIVWDIKDKYYCAIALQGFLSYSEQLSKSFTQWTGVIDVLAYQDRAQLLNALPKIRSMMISLGNEQAFSETLQAVRDVCRQWP